MDRKLSRRTLLKGAGVPALLAAVSAKVSTTVASSSMKELVKQKYPRLIYPEHPRGIDYDRERPNFRSQYPGGGGYAAFAFNVGYTRAMMQAALSS